MQPDILAYRRFYTSPLGACVADIVSAHIKAMAGHVFASPQTMVAALGYGLPYLERLEPNARTHFALMTGGMGAVRWPSTGPSRSALVTGVALPFADDSLDGLLLTHALEHASQPEVLLREVWRVLKPGGQVVALVPNRRRVWSALDRTPFGYGRPFSRPQLSEVMERRMFQTGDTVSAMMLPPFEGRVGVRLVRSLERPVRFIAPAFGGVLLMQGTKHVYTPAFDSSRRQMRRVGVSVGVPAGAARG